MINLQKLLPSAGVINKMSQSYASATSAKNFHSSRLKGKVAIVTASTDG